MASGEMSRPGNLSGNQWLGNLTLTEFWVPGLLGHVPRYLEGIGHAWSLAYEEQFYAVCGLLLIVSQRRMNRFFAGAAGITLLRVWSPYGTGDARESRRAVSRWKLDHVRVRIAVYYDRSAPGATTLGRSRKSSRCCCRTDPALGIGAPDHLSGVRACAHRTAAMG